MEKSCIQIYYGDGKGKTTAAMGLALRAAGQGMAVAVVQFLKNRPSGEIAVLQTLPNVTVYRGMPTDKFTFAMTEAEKAETRVMQTDHLRRALAAPCDVLVLDEALDVWALNLIDRAMLKALVDTPPAGTELVMTGHSLPPELAAKADYLTRMTAEKHPYNNGLAARRGIEY